MNPEGTNPDDLSACSDRVQFERALRRIILYRILESDSPKDLVSQMLADSKYRQENFAIERALLGTDPEQALHLEQLLNVLSPTDPRREQLKGLMGHE